MPVTFIYRIGKNPRTYYGKLDIPLSDDYPVDDEIKNHLVKGLTEHGFKGLRRNMFKVAVLSFYKSSMVFASSNENKVFDFACVENRGYDYWLNGRKITV